MSTRSDDALGKGQVVSKKQKNRYFDNRARQLMTNSKVSITMAIVGALFLGSSILGSGGKMVEFHWWFLAAVMLFAVLGIAGVFLAAKMERPAAAAAFTQRMKETAEAAERMAALAEHALGPRQAAARAPVVAPAHRSVYPSVAPPARNQPALADEPADVLDLDFTTTPAGK